MIARLAGRIEAVESEPGSGSGAGRCVIDVGGVGYLVHASTRTLAALPRPPEQARMLVETQLRDDAILLYGFADAAERDWFRLLTTVQGVGAKVALGVLSTLAPADLARAVAAGDRAALTRAPGVGARLAMRLVTELRERAGGVATEDAAPAAALAASGALADALSALVNLGYRRPEAERALERAAQRLGREAKLDALIRDSLKELVQ